MSRGAQLYLVGCLGLSALSARLVVGCRGGAESSVFTNVEDDGGDAPVITPTTPLSDSGPDPTPTPTTDLPSAGPPLTPPTCDPSVARESCTPPESTFPVPSTIMVAREGDAGCRQSLHAETRDGGAFACIVGTVTSCYGPLILGTTYPFTLGHSTSSGGTATGTFNVRFEGDSGAPSTVAIGGCFSP